MLKSHTLSSDRLPIHLFREQVEQNPMDNTSKQSPQSKESTSVSLSSLSSAPYSSTSSKLSDSLPAGKLTENVDLCFDIDGCLDALTVEKDFVKDRSTLSYPKNIKPDHRFPELYIKHMLQLIISDTLSDYIPEGTDKLKNIKLTLRLFTNRKTKSIDDRHVADHITNRLTSPEMLGVLEEYLKNHWIEEGDVSATINIFPHYYSQQVGIADKELSKDLFTTKSGPGDDKVDLLLAISAPEAGQLTRRVILIDDRFNPDESSTLYHPTKKCLFNFLSKNPDLIPSNLAISFFQFDHFLDCSRLHGTSATTTHSYTGLEGLDSVYGADITSSKVWTYDDMTHQQLALEAEKVSDNGYALFKISQCAFCYRGTLVGTGRYDAPNDYHQLYTKHILPAAYAYLEYQNPRHYLLLDSAKSHSTNSQSSHRHMPKPSPSESTGLSQLRATSLYDLTPVISDAYNTNYLSATDPEIAALPSSTSLSTTAPETAPMLAFSDYSTSAPGSNEHTAPEFGKLSASLSSDSFFNPCGQPRPNYCALVVPSTRQQSASPVIGATFSSLGPTDQPTPDDHGHEPAIPTKRHCPGL